MAWAQRDEPVTAAFSIQIERRSRRCEACGRLIEPPTVFVVDRPYCSGECAARAEDARAVPGLYLG